MKKNTDIVVKFDGCLNLEQSKDLTHSDSIYRVQDLRQDLKDLNEILQTNGRKGTGEEMENGNES